MNNYKSNQYIHTRQETRWATTEEIKDSCERVDLMQEDSAAAGLPVYAFIDKSTQQAEVYVDNSDTHSLIFGATGSKKTRLFCMPMINIFGKAGESFVVTDPKGELYRKTSGYLDAKGYDIKVINLRDIGKGDCWNPLKLPYDLYHSEKREAGVSLLNDFVTVIAAEQRQTTNDAFWPEMASSFALANLLFLAEVASPEEMNVASFSAMCNYSNKDIYKRLVTKMSEETIAGRNYKGVFSATSDQTLSSIFSCLFGFVTLFNTQKNLVTMLSENTIDLKSIGRKKTAVFLIVPDEKSTTHKLITMFVKQTYEVLISEAQKEENGQLPVRVNFVLDEFCNIPTIPDMPNMISAARSRNMRFFLVVQSIHQLKAKYGEDADTIKGNCDNWVFLTSKELDLLEEISRLCGSVSSMKENKRSLISVSELQRLKKEKGEALIFHSRQYPVVSELPDIDDYFMFKGHEPVQMKSFELKNVKVFSLREFAKKEMNGLAICPFIHPDGISEGYFNDEIVSEAVEKIYKLLKCDLRPYRNDLHENEILITGPGYISVQDFELLRKCLFFPSDFSIMTYGLALPFVATYKIKQQAQICAEALKKLGTIQFEVAEGNL